MMGGRRGGKGGMVRGVSVRYSAMGRDIHLSSHLQAFQSV